ncbi:MAG: hypothetical protein ACD_79C00014G0002 [uncultured bacterium]|nr:MAG: hypothetical protein ACD_79C00014G0002 [uncultured bacterium]
MKCMKKTFLSLILFIQYSFSLFSIPADVENISNEKYFPALMKAIKSANKSIYVCMYYISYPVYKKNKITEILDSLVDAAKKGVAVEVILDRSNIVNKSYEDMSKKNVCAFSFLKQNNIPVFYDELNTLTHAKYLIIDGESIISGSFNWSENSMSNNRENALLVKSKKLAEQMITEFKQIPRYSPEIPKDSIPIPIHFLKNKKLFPKMINRKYPQIVDFSFYALKKSFEQRSEKIKITMDEVINDLFQGNPKLISPKKDAVQSYMGKYLMYWKKKYPEFIVSYNRDEKTKDLYVELKFENKSDEDALYLDKLFWDDGWNYRLSNRAKFSLLYVLDKTESGRMGRYFKEPRSEPVKEYGINHSAFAYGLIELQRYNLIDKDINFSINGNEPNGYILKKFYIYDEFQKDLNLVKGKTDPEIFKSAIEIADLVNEPSDLHAISQIIELGEKYGVGILKDTIKTIKPKGGLSPYRRYDYVLAVIRNKGKEQ